MRVLLSYAPLAWHHAVGRTLTQTLGVSKTRLSTMCRNIKTLFNFEPPATEIEIRDASLQFVRKLSGFAVPSKANEAAFEAAVEEVAASARRLVQALVTNAPPKSREVEAAKAQERSRRRFESERT